MIREIRMWNPLAASRQSYGEWVTAKILGDAITGVIDMTPRGLLNSNEHLQLLTVQCPNCEVKWLAPGVKHGNTYACQECGRSFVVSKSKKETSQPSAGTSHIEKTSSF